MAEVTFVAEVAEKFPPFPPHAGFTNFHTASDHYGNVITHTLDNDTLLTSLCEFPLSPMKETKEISVATQFDFVTAKPRTKANNRSNECEIRRMFYAHKFC